MAWNPQSIGRAEPRPHDEPWPNLFVAGVGKSGTSSLCAYLGQHPAIFVPVVKEPNYFSPAASSGPAAASSRAAYLALYREGASHRIRVDGSVAYFWDRESAGAIASVAPDARILIVLRDPVERAHSHYWHCVHHGTEERTFRQAIDDELDGRRPMYGGRRAEPYIRRGRYLHGIRRFRGIFGDHVLIGAFEDLRQDPRAELRRLFALLDLDPVPADWIDTTPANESRRPRNRAASAVLRSPSARKLARYVVPSTLRGRTEARLLAPAPSPAVDPGVRARLEAVYAEERAGLESLLGRPLPW